jgi:hypothetical protein
MAPALRLHDVKCELGCKALHRAVNTFMERIRCGNRGEDHDVDLSSESEPLRLENTVSWDRNAEMAEAQRGPIII